MRTTTTYGYAARDPRALASPLPKFSARPAASVLAWTADQTAAFCLARDANNLAAVERKFAGACAALGAANRQKFGRRQAQAHAMRYLNAARAQLRAARAIMAASLAAAAASFPAN